MGSYATVYLDDGRSIESFKNGVDSLFLMLFSEADQVALRGEEAWSLLRHTYVDMSIEEAEILGFRATVGALRERLDLLGVDIDVISREFEEALEDEIELCESSRKWSGNAEDAGYLEERDAEALTLLSLSWFSWLDQLERRLTDGAAIETWDQNPPRGSAACLLTLFRETDYRHRLRAVLEALPEFRTITIDLAPLIAGGWMDRVPDPQSEGAEWATHATRGGLAPIVLTEGKFDSEVIAAAIRIRMPHLQAFIRLPDFHHRPEDGAAALRQTVRAFAAAGIPNRVVALFDNDSAARDVMRALVPTELPRNLIVTTLPHLALAANYPTVGPEGLRTMDINGRAVSIELFLGTDVLADESGLRPIQWGSIAGGTDEYQGSITGKGRIQEAFRAKVDASLQNPRITAGQDWSALDLLIRHLTSAIRSAH